MMKKIPRLSVLGAAAYLALAAMSGIAQDPSLEKRGANTKQGPDPNALGYDETPMLPGPPYRVHDRNRPHPRVVNTSPRPGDPPSDAIVLFNGKDLSHWTAARRGNVNNVTGVAEP